MDEPKTKLTTWDVEAFNAQYPTLEFRHTDSFHDGFLKVQNERLREARERMEADKAELALLRGRGGDSAVIARMFREMGRMSGSGNDAVSKAFDELMARMLELQALEQDRQRREELERRVYEDRADVWAAERQLIANGFAQDLARDDRASSPAANASRRLPTVADEEALEDDMQLG